MSADIGTTMTLTGTADEMFAMLMVFKKYDESIADKVYFSSADISDQSSCEDLMGMVEAAVRNFISKNEGDIFISAEGPYGYFGFLDEVDVFREMAEAAPGAKFHGSVHGVIMGSELQTMECILENNLLRTKYCCLEYDEIDNAYADFLCGVYPYSKFVKNFGLDSDFSEESYRELIRENIDDIYVYMDFEKFTEWMKVYTAAEINEDAFDAFMDELENSDAFDRDSFEEDLFASEAEITVYDPVKKCRVE